MNDKKFRKYSKESLQQEALKYQRRVDFYEKNPNAYHSARLHGLLDEICAHMKPKRREFTDEDLIEIGKKYKFRTDWKVNDSSSYTTATRRGLLDVCCEHMIMKYHVNTLESIRKRAYQVHCKAASEMGRTNELDYKTYLDIISQPCTYCNEFSSRKNHYTNETILLNSCDRIDSNLGYIITNCQPLCFVCQRMKSNYTEEFFKNHIKKLYETFTKI